jgi:hypothetical protein
MALPSQVLVSDEHIQKYSLNRCVLRRWQSFPPDRGITLSRPICQFLLGRAPGARDQNNSASSASLRTDDTDVDLLASLVNQLLA